MAKAEAYPGFRLNVWLRPQGRDVPPSGMQKVIAVTIDYTYKIPLNPTQFA
jgi:hypothetical protein